ncbi:hypothetical protein M3689_02635 [Alkalihalophilus marmarensis]|jgi:uncharacterized membrane-anchored protein|uniref:Uncharacterized protein n=1 Tax=Alkalihalophilus marmarensis DSM 21297 TaxID=1188261 RepID=U6SRU9_9BACI|nr:hypothetical protein [Alkalihalophilus marmarensis]ERN54429.1 hypothetical protein A33I_08390 [Alkalihalophilus marmarensis DSM 21297]MCM3488200.1 hypothetical protein [Alkalihalophilus marmarensis]
MGHLFKDQKDPVSTPFAIIHTLLLFATIAALILGFMNSFEGIYANLVFYVLIVMSLVNGIEAYIRSEKWWTILLSAVLVIVWCYFAFWM